MRLAFLLAALPILTQPPAEGAILRVPQDYATIQAAIDAAASGDTVLVSRGTYPGGLLISGKTIRLASNYTNTADPGDVSQTIISGGSPVITIESTAVDTTVQGLTLQGGSYGLVNHAARMNILNNRFINLSSDAVSFENAGGVCRDNYFESSGDDGIDSDHSSADTTIENNTILGSGDDGMEIRLHAYTGPMINIVIRNNYIAGSGEDGIQLIDYAGLSNRTFRIERNVILGSAMVGLGCMPGGNTVEDFGGAPLLEEVQVVNNTFSGNPYALTGGDNMLLMNNIFTGSTQTAVKRVSASSLASYNDFWSNGLDYSNANVDLATTRFENPLLDANYNLRAGSPSIDAGAASLVWNGKTVNAPPYSGPAPDLGARETSGGPALPTVTVTATDPIAAELGLDPGGFTVSRTGDTAAPLIVSYSLAGTASNGADYEGLTGSVTIAADASSALVTVAPVGDPLEEGSETVILDLLGHPAYILGSPNSASVTIVDDDLVVPMVTITATDAFAAEAGSDPGIFTVTRTGDTAPPLTVDYTVGGDATNGLDYQAIATSVVIPGGFSSATITVTPIDDVVVDEEEVVLTIAASPSYVVGTPGGASVTITDDDPIPADYYTVTPCRLSDSRIGAPGPLLAGEARSIATIGNCGIPAGAVALALNITVTQPTAQGSLRLYPTGQPLPLASTLNYSAAQTRANNAVAGLSAAGSLSVYCSQSSGSVHFIVDVMGYFK